VDSWNDWTDDSIDIEVGKDAHTDEVRDLPVSTATWLRCAPWPPCRRARSRTSP
jgi:hypothetical protein